MALITTVLAREALMKAVTTAGSRSIRAAISYSRLRRNSNSEFCAGREQPGVVLWESGWERVKGNGEVE